MIQLEILFPVASFVVGTLVLGFGFVISLLLIAAYMNKIVPYLEKVLGR